jgi:hypothetical protein
MAKSMYNNDQNSNAIRQCNTNCYRLGIAFSGLDRSLKYYPCVSLRYNKTKIRCNFAGPFKVFNVEERRGEIEENDEEEEEEEEESERVMN